jgi:HJR/Mrr/RecB family endonuclease
VARRLVKQPQGNWLLFKLSITVDLIAQLRRNPEQLYNLEPRQFEELIAELLASFGWSVEPTGATRDGGYDILGISSRLLKNPRPVGEWGNFSWG